jgi:tRNA-2-methylthio-N6-dimethylallyladenosine synthase
LKILNSKKLTSFFVYVNGCQQNEHDGVRISHLLSSIGLIETDAANSDLIIAVACSVRQTAVDRIFGLVKNNQGKKIIITGCVLESDRKKFAKKDVVFWDIEKPEDLAKIIGVTDSRTIQTALDEGSKLSSSVPIMFGCNNFCTYCATAHTRGRERSRNMSAVIKDVQALIDNGKKNILLLGQTIDSYKDPETGARLDILFTKLNELSGDFEISFLSNHPKDMTDEIIEAVAKLPKIKKEIHLPLQSGSNEILKAMNRPYTKEQYLEIIKKIRSQSPLIEITTDVIIGFPGETEEDFQETVEVMDQVGYKMAYLNKYSPRAGTAAYALGDPIPHSEKQRRWRILDEVLKKTMH